MDIYIYIWDITMDCMGYIHYILFGYVLGWDITYLNTKEMQFSSKIHHYLILLGFLLEKHREQIISFSRKPHS